MQDHIPIHSATDFESMRQAGKLGAMLLDFITPYVQPGVTTDELDARCAQYIKDHGATAAPLGYGPITNPFPKSICTSVNHVICHGIPGPKKLQEGDIVNIDVTPLVHGWHGDTSRMYYAGKVGVKAKKLVEVTYECLMRAIDVVKPGVPLGIIGKTIQTIAEKNGFSVVRDFCGHGLGQVFHTAPNVLHYYDPRSDQTILQEGMFFTIEPMINAGSWDAKMLDDGWTAVTKDKSLSAQFEHSIGITQHGVEIFTLSPRGWHCPPYEG